MTRFKIHSCVSPQLESNCKLVPEMYNTRTVSHVTAHLNPASRILNVNLKMSIKSFEMCPPDEARSYTSVRVVWVWCGCRSTTTQRCKM